MGMAREDGGFRDMIIYALQPSKEIDKKTRQPKLKWMPYIKQAEISQC